MNTPLTEIDVVANARRTFDRIDELARSMAEIGQLQPVIVRREGIRFLLLCGERRVRAAKTLGWAEIAAEVVTLDGLRAEMAALDSNLQSDALRGLDLDEALARRKAIHEALHPSTRHGGGDRGAGRRAAADAHPRPDPIARPQAPGVESAGPEESSRGGQERRD